MLVPPGVWFLRCLEWANQYGGGARPPPLFPPVDPVSDCHAVIVPSFLPATLMLANPDGRLPPIISSVARSRNSFTGRPPLAFESRAASRPQRSVANLLPNPPPTYCMLTWMLEAGILRLLERSPPIPDTFCVGGRSSM